MQCERWVPLQRDSHMTAVADPKVGWFAVLVIFSGMALIPASLAANKGHRYGYWWLYGFLLFPVALIHAFMMPARTKRSRRPGRRSAAH
jgi:hypothetical protein